jgi:hypothetical protein
MGSLKFKPGMIQLEDRSTPSAAGSDLAFGGNVQTLTANMLGSASSPDTIRASGPGGGRVQILDSQTQAVLADFYPFGQTFHGGLSVAVGDVDANFLADFVPGAERAELIVAAGPGGSARVKVYDFKFPTNQLETRADFYGLEGPNFRGGATVATGDFTGEGGADVVVAAGPGGGPRIAVYSGFLSGHDPARIADFFGLADTSFRGGVSIAVGNFNGASHAGRDSFLGSDLAVGAGSGGAPRVTIWNGTALGNQTTGVIDDFFAADDSSSRNGVKLSIHHSGSSTPGQIYFGPIDTFLVLERPGIGTTERDFHNGDA